MAKDRFSDRQETVIEFGKRHQLLVPSDTADLPEVPKAVWVETGGNAVVRDSDGNTLTYKTYDGSWLPIRPTRVMATGTTGTYYVNY